MDALGFIDGRFVDLSEKVVAMEDRGYQFGDGVYEYAKVYNGKCFALKPHIERLFRSLKEIQLAVDFTFDELKDVHEQLISRSGIMSGGIYLQVTRGWAPRAHHFPDVVVPCLTLTIRPSTMNVSQWDTGAGILLTPDERWLRCDIKSLNLLGNVLSKQKAKEANCYEAVQVRDHYVTEGTSSNFFIVKDGVLLTYPATNLILKGITRSIVMEEIAPKLGILVLEKMFEPEMIGKADEAFLSGTTTEIMPVVKVDGKPVNSGNIGPITTMIMNAYREKIKNECGGY